MSAAELRRAAKTLRERAGAATGGPWRVCAEGSEGSRITPSGEHLTPRERSRFIGIMNGRVQPEDGRNAAYVATVHPGVGLALADLLDRAASVLEWKTEHRATAAAMWGAEREALNLARLINGGPS